MQLYEKKAPFRVFPLKIFEIFQISSCTEHLKATTSEFMFTSINILVLTQPAITYSKLQVNAGWEKFNHFH